MPLSPRRFVFVALLAAAAQADSSGPPGGDKSLKTRTLEAGAKALQSNAPLAPMDIYLNGFHADKRRAEHQMESHHYCHQVNQDFAQCVLFDGNGRNAKLQGVEYIVSEKLFNTLPKDERKFWHPHNYEILSGQLIAPNIPQAAEKQLMKDKINSYGKTWHTWHTGVFGMPSDALPLGEPALMWSFNRDGEANAAMVAARDKRLGVNTTERRQARRGLTSLAKPQHGVDAMREAFNRPTQPLEGVRQAPTE